MVAIPPYSLSFSLSVSLCPSASSLSFSVPCLSAPHTPLYSPCLSLSLSLFPLLVTLFIPLSPTITLKLNCDPSINCFAVAAEQNLSLLLLSFAPHGRTIHHDPRPGCADRDINWRSWTGFLTDRRVAGCVQSVTGEGRLAPAAHSWPP